MNILDFNGQAVTPFFETERLWLVPVSEVHCNATYLSWLHDKQSTMYLVSSGIVPQSIDDLVAYVQQMAKTNTLFFAIHLKENMKHIGNVKVANINRVHSYADYGIFMGDRNEWGKGYAKEASMVLLHHCFTVTNIRKITLGVLGRHSSAKGLYLKMGFQEEGVQKKQCFINGQYEDVIIMGLFQDDFLARLNE